MADILDVFGFSGLPPSRSSTIAGFQNIPVPGGFDIGGIVSDIIQRFPIPRPRLPLPRRPGGKVPTPRGPRPFPVPIPDIFGIFGDGDCPEQTCCKGEHVAKTKDPNSPSFGKCVTNRRMNALNPRALRRATRRLSSFNRAARKTQKELKKICR